MPPGACASACRRDRRGRPTRPGRGSSAASVRVSSSSAALLAPYGPQPGIRAVRGVARDVHDQPAPLGEQRNRELNQRERRARVDGKDRARSACTSNSISGPMAPSSDALLTSRSSPPSSRAASTSRARTAASVTSPCDRRPRASRVRGQRFRGTARAPPRRARRSTRSYPRSASTPAMTRRVRGWRPSRGPLDSCHVMAFTSAVQTASIFKCT